MWLVVLGRRIRDHTLIILSSSKIALQSVDFRDSVLVTRCRLHHGPFRSF